MHWIIRLHIGVPKSCFKHIQIKPRRGSDGHRFSPKRTHCSRFPNNSFNVACPLIYIYPFSWNSFKQKPKSCSGGQKNSWSQGWSYKKYSLLPHDKSNLSYIARISPMRSSFNEQTPNWVWQIDSKMLLLLCPAKHKSIFSHTTCQWSFSFLSLITISWPLKVLIDHAYFLCSWSASSLEYCKDQCVQE